jgi:hypothetical protein
LVFCWFCRFCQHEIEKPQKKYFKISKYTQLHLKNMFLRIHCNQVMNGWPLISSQKNIDFKIVGPCLQKFGWINRKCLSLNTASNFNYTFQGCSWAYLIWKYFKTLHKKIYFFENVRVVEFESTSTKPVFLKYDQRPIICKSFSSKPLLPLISFL